MVKNILKELEKVQIDNKTNIKIDRITGDSKISIYAAEIAPLTKLKPHFHKEGIEVYQILGGSGQMKISEYQNKEIHWINYFDVKEGDCFSITANQVHQIVNNSNKVLRAIFTCKSDHLGDDRFFIKE
jgi:mannose-6-phosphate isomerase-like protein (cupin superfamily)